LTQLQALVVKKLAEFSEEANDTVILMKSVEKKNYVFIRDKPAVDHLIYQDYKYRKNIDQFNEKVHCPFAVAKSPFLKRKRAFAYPLKTKWNALFDPE
jgi:glutamate receptor, ionotropic, invertebrate